MPRAFTDRHVVDAAAVRTAATAWKSSPEELAKVRNSVPRLRCRKRKARPTQATARDSGSEEGTESANFPSVGTPHSLLLSRLKSPTPPQRLMNSTWIAIATHEAATHGESRSPILASFQGRPLTSDL